MKSGAQNRSELTAALALDFSIPPRYPDAVGLNSTSGFHFAIFEVFAFNFPVPDVIAIDARPAMEKVLVGIINHPRDLILAREQRWYRIPVSSARKWLARHWPPKWIAFYQTKIFREHAFTIRHFAEILNIRTATRAQLLPAEPRHPRASELYYQIDLGPLHDLPAPIVSRRWRRIVFIPTNWRKFVSAKEINDLYDESPLEDLLWDELRRLNQSPSRLHLPERQEFITANGNEYALDFAFYCEKGKMAVETDGDTWHSDPVRIPEDSCEFTTPLATRSQR